MQGAQNSDMIGSDDKCPGPSYGNTGILSVYKRCKFNLCG